MIDWFNKYSGQSTWMYVYTLSIATAFNFFSQFFSRDVVWQAVYSIILGGVGAFIGFILFTYTLDKKPLLKMLFLISILFIILGVWLFARNYFFPINTKGSKFV